ncbi:MAG: PAS domain S-box [Bacteroidetes bacterium]|nr:MAG: PAS domain S-box [Bacteroidota bacterium]
MTDYTRQNKQQLIEEIERLKAELSKYENVSRDIRSVKEYVRYNPQPSIFSDKELIYSVLGNINELVYYIEITPDQKRVVRYIGPQVEQILGIPLEYYTQNIDKVIERCHPDDIPGMFETAKRLKEEKTPKSFVYRFMNDIKKKYIWIEETVYPQYDESGRHSSNIGVTRDITEKKNAELELLEHQKMLSLVLNNIGEIVYYVEYKNENEREVKFIGENIEKMLGMSTQEYIDNNSSLINYCHLDDRQAIKDTVQRIRTEKKPQTFFYRFKHWKTGEYVWIEEQLFPRYDENGRHFANFGVTRDVTERALAEQRLRESEKKLALISASSPVGIFITDGKGKPVYINKKVEEISGLPPGKILQHAWFRRMHPEDAKRLIEKIRLAVSDKTEYSDEFRFTKNPGEDHSWFRIKVNVIIGEKNEFQGWVGTVEDITPGVESERKLRESELRFRMLAENASDIIYRYIIYPEPRYEYVSPSALAITGYSPEDFYKDPYLGFTIVHPDDRKLLQQSEGIIRDKGNVQAVDGDQGLVIRWVRKDGKAIWTETRNKPIFNEEGRIVAIEGISRDISLQKKNEDALRESEERFKLLSQAAMEGIVLIENGRVVDANEQFLRIFGYERQEELTGVTIDRIITPQQIGALNEPRHGAGGSTYEIKCRRKDGKEIFVEARGQDIPFGDREIRILAINDITERKLTEIALRESERTLSTLMANLPGMAYRCAYDENWTMLFVSQGCAELTGYNPADLLANKKRAFSQIVHPEDRAVGKKEIEEAINNKTPFEKQYRIISKQGEEKWVWDKGEGVFSPAGELLFIEGFLTDITEYRQLEKEQLRAQLAEENNKRLEAEIEERKRIEGKLQANQKYVRLLIDSSLDMICASDRQGIVTEFNLAAQQAFGYTAEEVIGKHVSFLYVNPKERIDVLNNLLAGTGVFSGEVVNKKKDGSPFTAYLSASALRDENGEVIGSMGVSRDISVLKAAEQELRDSEERYRDLFENATDLIQSVDMDGRIIYMNSAWKYTLGYSEEEMQEKTIFDIMTPDSRAHCMLVMGKIASGKNERIDKLEIAFRTKSGKTVYVEGNVNLRRENGTPHSTRGIFRDITERKIAEEKLRVSEEHIRNQGAKMNAVFETSTHHIWTVDRQSRLTSFNANQANWLEKNYGVKAELGLSMIKGKMVSNEEYNNFWAQKLALAFEGQQQYFETSFPDNSGNESWREVYLNPIYDEHRRVTEVSCIAHDVTDKKLAEEKLRLSLKEKEVLLKEVHHRVKNNLQVISSILNLQSSYVRDKKTLELLRESQNRIKSMAFIHESLYQTKDFSSINFSEYVENISKNLVHSYSSSETPPELNLDASPRLFLNLDTAIPCGLIINELLSNALKYAFRDGREGKIDVGLKESKGSITISIADNGPGLPEHIDYRNTESLGLQLVVTLVEQINGKIRLDNKKGTKFVIDFKYKTTNS